MEVRCFALLLAIVSMCADDFEVAIDDFIIEPCVYLVVSLIGRWNEFGKVVSCVVTVAMLESILNFNFPVIGKFIKCVGLCILSFEELSGE